MKRKIRKEVKPCWWPCWQQMKSDWTDSLGMCNTRASPGVGVVAMRAVALSKACECHCKKSILISWVLQDGKFIPGQTQEVKYTLRVHTGTPLLLAMLMSYKLQHITGYLCVCVCLCVFWLCRNVLGVSLSLLGLAAVVPAIPWASDAMICPPWAQVSLLTSPLYCFKMDSFVCRFLQVIVRSAS